MVWKDDQFEYGQFHLPNEIISVKRELTVAANYGDRYIPASADGWAFDESNGAISKPNPLGTVALLEFRNQSLLDNDPISDIAGVMAMQDAVNLVWAYVLNALDYASLPGRVILNGEIPMEPILNEDGQKIGERPFELDSLIRDRVAFIGGDNAKVAEWSPATLDAYSKVIEQAIQHIAAQTRTPGHYLLSGGNVPAAGYELTEAGLVSKAIERTSYATPEVREIYRLAALADGETAKAKQIETAKVLWAKPQYRSEAQLMDGLLKMRQIGFPSSGSPRSTDSPLRRPARHEDGPRRRGRPLRHRGDSEGWCGRCRSRHHRRSSRRRRVTTSAPRRPSVRRR
ncbi:hypothetical protein GCM10025864_39490 [Luteimicrobium album]|uniref:Phage portal protein n=1 Tax=Luteimicrobium album TaxID=1054550 RepID=A0ABQ6I8Y0_9MICO|nr:hypothetical protein [Luteimicrobium album]GMA26190.1 hypothetical protein GCM10025864_39490 [Luteimicrobium album]